MTIGANAFLTMVVSKRQVEHMLMGLDIALSPPALLGFLQGVVAPYLEQRAQMRFIGEGDDVSGTWAPLKESTQNIRASLGYDPEWPINVRTWELEQYITEGGAKSVTFPSGAGIRLPSYEASGELLDKVMRAQQGDERTVPRPVLGMNENDLIAVLIQLGGYINESARL